MTCGRSIVLILLAMICVGGTGGGPQASAAPVSPVVVWARLGDALGEGLANWHTLPIMHMAMHDALNAARPVYERWMPAGPDEPYAAGADPEAAMVSAARHVLLLLHPGHEAEIEQTLAESMSRIAPGRARDLGAALGYAVGAEWVRHRAGDGFKPAYYFTTSDQPGLWRPTPPSGRNSGTTKTIPFLSADRIEPGAPTPPALGSAEYSRDANETRRIGGKVAPDRGQAETEAALFWAYQLSQRGYIDLELRLLEQHPQPRGLWDEARTMSQLASALADSAIIVWAEKERFDRWRPITAIRQGGYGVIADPAWDPLVETPYFPEYPAGHSSDCFTGAGVLTALFGSVVGPIEYRSLGRQTSATVDLDGAGQHTQLSYGRITTRVFPDIASSAEECAQSCIWAGAHFRSANVEARRIAAAVVRRALVAVLPVGGAAN